MRWLLPALGLLLACGQDKGGLARSSSEDTGMIDACEAEAQGELPPFPLSLVVLAEDASAPQEDPTDPVSSCAAGDTRWPCSHLTALEQTFVDAAGQPVCDPADPRDCVQFRHKRHAFYADIANTDCEALIDLANRELSPTVETGQFINELRQAVHDCTDPDVYDTNAISVFVADNPVPGVETSFGTSYKSSRARDCGGYYMVELGRLPTDGTALFQDGANEHEIGHVFGLEHVCHGMDDGDYPSTNIMQGTGGSCCCECGQSQGHDADSTWATEVCADCSTYDTADQCLTGQWDDDQCNEPDCLGWVRSGQRDLGFSTSTTGNSTAETDQISTILATARGQWGCWCEAASADTKRSWRVAGEEATCAPGSGRFTFLARGPGRAGSLPILVEGDQPGPLARLMELPPLAPGEELPLSWDCPPEEESGEAYTSWRPRPAFDLPLTALGAPVAQQLRLRPDLARGLLWVELAGRPGEVRVLRLTRGEGDRWRWRWHGMGAHLQGSIALREGQLSLQLEGGDWQGRPIPARDLELLQAP